MPEPSTRPLRVLLVDDQEGDLLLMRSLLHGAEIDPEVAALTDAVLRKPVGLATIRGALARALERRRAATA